MTADKKNRILFIEDDATQAMIYRIAFESGGYEVLTAETGRAGFKMAKAEQPDLIMLDMILGDMSGLDVLKLLKGEAATRQLKVVVFSNLNKRELTMEAKKLGATDVLAKIQYVPKDIVKKVEDYL